MTKKLVIYHGGCIDGFAAAWAVYSVIGDGKDVEYFPAFYGGEPPNVTNKDVIIADFSYPYDKMVNIMDYARSVSLFDHHKSAYENLKYLTQENKNLLFDMKRSGAGIVWDEFTEPTIGEKRPWLIDYVEDRDLWNWKLDNSREVNAYISTIPFDFKVWDKVYEKHPELTDWIIDAGAVVLRRIKQYNKSVYEQHSFPVDFHNLIAVIINAPYMGISELLEFALEESGCDIAVGFSFNNKGYWQYSLRARKNEEIDVSEIAKLYGGGGHKSAAGFVVKELIFDQVKWIDSVKR